MATRTTELFRRERTDTTLRIPIDLFTASKQIEGRSPKALGWYRANLDRFAGFVSGREPARLGELSVDKSRPFYSWHPRYQVQGFDALAEKDSQLRRRWNQIPDDVRNQVVEIALFLYNVYYAL